MKLLLITMTLATSFSTFAAVPSKVTAAAAALKAQDIKTVIKAVKNTDGNPCMPEGTSYQVDLKVKEASFNRLTSKVVYKWVTVKTVNVAKGGQVMEVCAE